MMHTLVHCALLARRDIFRDMGSGFRGENAQLGTSDVTTIVALITIAVLTFWGLSRLAVWREGREPYDDPKLLFKHLCRAHQLNRADRTLLSEMGRLLNLSSTAKLFLQPQLFDIPRDQPELIAHASEIQSLRRRLFGELSDPLPDTDQ